MSSLRQRSGKHLFRSFVAVSVLASLLVLAGCVSLPQPKSEDSALVIIPTTVWNSSGAHFSRKYYLQVSDGYGEFQISDFRETYVAIVIDNPGVRITGIRSVVDTSLHFTGPDSFDRLNISLPYRPGQVSILDLTFGLSMSSTGGSEYISRVDLYKTDPKKSAELIQQLRANKNNSVWFQE